jgi:hypothetical protein
MAFPTKDPGQMRLGALMILVTVPFFLYAAYVRRDDPGWAATCVLTALVILGAGLYFLRRAARLRG